MESTLSSPCSCSDPPLTHQGAALAHLDSLPPHDLVLWTEGSVPYPFGKGGSGVLANYFLCGTEATLSFLAGPVCSSFPLKPVPFCTFFAGLSSTNKSAISLLFSYHLTLVLFLATLSSRPSFLLSQSLWQKLSFLFSCSIRLQWVPGHSFLPRNNTADELARWEALLAPSVIPCSLSPLISRIHSCLFLDWRGTVSSKYFGTQVPSILLRNLHSLVMLAVSSLVFAAMDTALF